MSDEEKPAVLKDGRRVTIRTFKPSDKEGLVSMYAGLSQESLRWSMPPYNRERIERMTSDLENRIIVLGFDGQRVVGHLQISLATNARFRGTGDLFIYLHQDYQNAALGDALMTEGYRAGKDSASPSSRVDCRCRKSSSDKLVREGRILAGGSKAGELSRRGREISGRNRDGNPTMIYEPWNRLFQAISLNLGSFQNLRTIN